MMTHADQEAQPGQRQHSTGHRGRGAHLQDARMHTEVHEQAGAPALAAHAVLRGVSRRRFAYDDRPNHLSCAMLVHRPFRTSGAIVGLRRGREDDALEPDPRFYDVKEGAILVDGTDIRDVSLASLRGQIALVTQETVALR